MRLDICAKLAIMREAAFIIYQEPVIFSHHIGCELFHRDKPLVHGRNIIVESHTGANILVHLDSIQGDREQNIEDTVNGKIIATYGVQCFANHVSFRNIFENIQIGGEADWNTLYFEEYKWRHQKYERKK